jgi:hypothetical protein
MEWLQFFPSLSHFKETPSQDKKNINIIVALDQQIILYFFISVFTGGREIVIP